MRNLLVPLAAVVTAFALSGCAVVSTAADVTGAVISTTVGVAGDVVGAAADTVTGQSKDKSR